MDKGRFVELAPLYYALAVARCVKSKAWGRALSIEGILAEYTVPDETDPEAGYCYLSSEPVLAHALRWLRENDLIVCLDDEFGSSIYESSALWDKRFDEFVEDGTPPFYNYARASDGDAWLRTALVGVNREFHQLGIANEDFEDPDRQWRPLPLDRADPILQEAISRLDETLEHARSDNGYSANVPEERSYVVQSLSAASRALKEDATTSVPFIRRYVLEPLALLLRRFKGAALGVLAAAAKDAISSFLKERGVEWLTDIFG